MTEEPVEPWQARAGALPWPIRLRVFARSLLLQAAWNPERMQNLGMAFALGPALDVLYPDDERRQRAYRRHLELFNAHPYLAALVLGVALRLEREGSQGDTGQIELLRSFKLGVIGSLGAIGDAFFWASLKPFCVVISVLWAMLIGWQSAVWVFLIGFNAVHLWLRWRCFQEGYRQGVLSTVWLQGLNLPRQGRRLKDVALLATGFFAAWAPLRAWGAGGIPAGMAWIGIMGALILTSWYLLKTGVSVVRLLYGVCAGSVLVSFILE